MLETGLLVFLGLIGLVIKLPIRTVLRGLSYPLTIDICTTVGIFVLYGGSVTGILAATFCGLLVSATISVLRWAIGYIDNRGRYFPGIFTIPAAKIKPPITIRHGRSIGGTGSR